MQLIVFQRDELLKAIEQQENAVRLKQAPFINYILGPNQTLRTTQQPRIPFRPNRLRSYLNPDTAVLRRPNRTHVTAAIAKLADGHFREQLFVVGAPSPAPDDAKEEHQRKQKLGTLRRLIQRANYSDQEIDYGKLKKTQYLDKIQIHYSEKDVETFSVVYNLSLYCSTNPESRLVMSSWSILLVKTYQRI